jgi:cell division protein FtsZ
VINRDFADVKTTMAGMGYAVMGTASRSGANRAVDAAVAAMASPLLEAGAIDGARGILINITGSSSLKLNEVNEASTIIQNAAHEDANIIFGAVLDENMGDEVKITVIATGFKEQKSQPRRERMLAEATLPTARYDAPVVRGEVPIVSLAPIAPRVTTPRMPIESEPEPSAVETVAPISVEPISAEAIHAPAMEAPVFEVRVEQPPPAAEVVEQRLPEGDGRPFPYGHRPEDWVLTPGPEVEPELVPVPRSVFDDEFFRTGRVAPSAPPPPAVASSVDSRMPSARGFETPDAARPLRLQSEPEPQHYVPTEPVVRTFGGGQEHHPESDELDIPAFLRRGH